MKVLRVATLDILVATLRLLMQGFSHTSRSNILDYLEYFFLYLPSSLTAFVTYFGLRLGDKIVVPKELRVPLGDLDIYYNLSSFLKSYEKMADVDIDHLENMIRRTHILMRQVKIFLSTQEEE